MAILDEKGDACVVRIVYDGPPFSGKTTSLGALSEHLARPLESPGEHDGRTLYFDWLDYTAGRFNGRPIRCQVVSVPGQRGLVARRKALLAEADSIVFVADTGSIGLDLSLKYARELGAFLSTIKEPRPGIIISANKRDVDDAVPIPELIEAFQGVGLNGAVIESTATEGTGVRETFLFGVRLALDRVRELDALGLLVSGRPEIDSCADLLNQLTESEGSKTAPVSAAPLRPALSGVTAGSRDIDKPAQEKVEVHSSPMQEIVSEALEAEQSDYVGQNSRPAAGELPDPSVPSGFIWPPVDGRIVLQQALVTNQPVAKKLTSGNLYGFAGNGWEIYSRRQDVFPDQISARTALVEWARLHVRNNDILSDRRCIVLSPGENGWRLWQIIKAPRSVETFLLAGRKSTVSREHIEHLLVASRKLIQAAELFGSASVKLPLRLTTIGVDSTQPKFVGLMPGFDEENANGSVTEVNRSKLIADCLGRHLRKLGNTFERGQLVSELEAVGSSSPENEQLTNMLLEQIDKYEVAG